MDNGIEKTGIYETPGGAGFVEKKPEANLDINISAAVKNSFLETHIRELSRFPRKAYSEDTAGIERAKNYIITQLQKAGLRETQNSGQMGFQEQKFIMQRDFFIRKDGSEYPQRVDRLELDTSTKQTTATENTGKILAHRTQKEYLNIAQLAQYLDNNYPYFIKSGPKVIGSNLLVRIPGVKNLNKKIILGAHYDTFENNPGANDNGSGVVCLLEAARILAQHQFENTIEIIFFTAEDIDNGDLGSKLYIKTLSEQERKNIAAVLIVDTIAGPPKGIKNSEPVFLNLEIDRNNQKNSRQLAESCQKVINHAVPGLKKELLLIPAMTAMMMNFKN